MGENQQNWKNLIENEAKLRGYSKKTAESYKFYVNKFLQSGRSAKGFLLELINDNKSDETVRAAGFAIKFYLKITNKDSSVIDNLPNVKREKKLPVVLAKEEVEQMIISTKNHNHRTILQIGYGAGLRVSEVINLKWKDIDFKRNTIHIKGAKGKKDRIVMLSPKVKKSLQKLEAEKNGLVFKTTRGKKYTTRTVQLIVRNAARKAQINKNVTPHTLRHSFATHLLEKGTDIRYIRDLLGHSDINTTLIYTKVSTKDISKIKSPLD
jgi:integrase/recombinase XerD